MEGTEIITDEDISLLKTAIERKAGGSEMRRQMIIIGSILRITTGRSEMLG